jgi:hypothetical protein
MHGFTKGWLASWQANGWRTSAKKPVKNRELWEQLLAEAGRHEIEWVLVKGHDGVKLNERVDALAVAQRDLHARRRRLRSAICICKRGSAGPGGEASPGSPERGGQTTNAIARQLAGLTRGRRHCIGLARYAAARRVCGRVALPRCPGPPVTRVFSGVSLAASCDEAKYDRAPICLKP